MNVLRKKEIPYKEGRMKDIGAHVGYTVLECSNIFSFCMLKKFCLRMWIFGICDDTFWSCKPSNTHVT